MRTEIKEAKTYYISNDGKYYKDEWYCTLHEKWIEKDNRRVDLQERWNGFFTTISTVPGECPTCADMDSDDFYTYITIRSKEELEKINDMYTTADSCNSEILYDGNFPMTLIARTEYDFDKLDLGTDRLYLYTLDEIKYEALSYWKEMGYKITITKKEESEE